MATENFQVRAAWADIVEKLKASPSGRVAGAVIRDLLHREGHVAWGTLHTSSGGNYPKCVGTKDNASIFFKRPVSVEECRSCILFNHRSGACSVGMDASRGSGVDTTPDALSSAYTPASPRSTGTMRGFKIG